MELQFLQSGMLANFFARIITHMDTVMAEELFCAALIPLLALFVGRRANRWIDTHPQTTLGITVIDLIAPLLSPLLAMGGMLAIMALFTWAGLAVTILPFVLKLTVAWFAIGLVQLMSSKRLAGWFVVLAIIPITLLHVFGLWQIAINLLSAMQFSIGNAQFNLYLILKGIIAIIAMYWLASIVVKVTDQRMRRMRNLRASNRTLILKIVQIFLYCFIFIFGMQMLGINLTALSVFGGALGVGLGFGLQKIASNFVSGIILLFEKSIEVDDLIELADGTKGFVRQTRARFTLLEMEDGKEVLIPNEEFISQRVVSWTHSNKKGRVDIVLQVSYDSDLELARKIMLEAARHHPKRLKSIEPVCVLTAFNDNGIQISLQFWIMDMTEGRQEPKSEVMMTIWQQFQANGIRIPFPQREMRVMAVDGSPLTPSNPVDRP